MPKSAAKKGTDKGYATSSTPKTSPKAKTVKILDVTPPQRPQISSAATTGAVAKAEAEVTELAEKTREEELALLPSLQAVTGAESVDIVTTAVLAMLRQGAAAAAAFDESATPEKVDECVEKAWKLIVNLLADPPSPPPEYTGSVRDKDQTDR